jgi:hypothetical protein
MTTATLPTPKLERGRVVNRGMGGFLNPPAHPEHTFSVEVDLRRRPENRGGMSLSCAAECAHLDLSTRRAARTMLAAWSRPAIDSLEVKAWISQVLGYFACCYQNTAAGDECWNAGKLLIDTTRNPLDTPDQHAGVHLIRRYYPEYQPTAEDFAGARWGK